ncbi:adenylate/guanylate cyclase domain-containing protein [Amniculibacterium aquaticum]|uniref:adenylate/guanylate cyclase domain-containing protein n=1 Tax=Amniculibacterium aquaticum TaxID=2479858 RepID=UPI000F5B07A1|nr:adenylate/guanylate cyclase domain-containing protein [Amniculibacterium aquaticum]
MKGILDEITADVIDIKNKNFQYSSTNLVPSRHDTSLTFERGQDKIGKEIETCVLYVDIRNSVELNRKHHTQTMGRIYSIFSKSMLKLAKHHGGSVRNIIGDRVMIVFPSKDCYTNAVDCAISIYHVSEYIINSNFKEVDFKCGIGIDFGLLKVVKVGLHRKGTENIDNKNLVWVGYPANIASRLTDVANKTYNNSSVKVTYYPYNFGNMFGLTSLLGQQPVNKSNDVYLDTATTRIHTNEEFSKSLSFNNTLGVCYSGGKLIRFDKIESKIDFPPILMTTAVYNGFKKANPTRICITGNFWKEITNHQIKNVSTNIYGGTVNWKI